MLSGNAKYLNCIPAFAYCGDAGERREIIRSNVPNGGGDIEELNVVEKMLLRSLSAKVMVHTP